MRYKTGHREEARARMVEAAGRGFRRKGFSGIGVDGLAKEAEVTSGAFYSHFPSKDAAFREALEAGIEELRAAIAAFQSDHGADWLDHFVDFYLGEKRTCELGTSCTMQALSPEVARADGETQAIYRAAMQRVVEQIASGWPQDAAEEAIARAWLLLSVLGGAVTLARAVGEPSLSSQIADVARAIAKRSGGQTA